MLLKGQVAVVTGAGSGIGRVIAAGFAAQGARVAIMGRREDRLQETARLSSSGMLVVAGDVSQEADVQRLYEQVMQDGGRCDILVNNAGVFKPDPGVLLHESPVDDWDEVLRTNVRGAFLCLRAFVPQMVRQRYGRIINLTSGLKHAPGHGVYSVSKSALDSLTRTAAHELAEHNIQVNALNPGWVRTEMATNAPDDPGKVLPVALRMATLPEDEPSGVEFQA